MEGGRGVPVSVLADEDYVVVLVVAEVEGEGVADGGPAAHLRPVPLAQRGHGLGVDLDDVAASDTYEVNFK